MTKPQPQTIKDIKMWEGTRRELKQFAIGQVKDIDKGMDEPTRIAAAQSNIPLEEVVIGFKAMRAWIVLHFNLTEKDIQKTKQEASRL